MSKIPLQAPPRCLQGCRRSISLMMSSVLKETSRGLPPPPQRRSENSGVRGSPICEKRPGLHGCMLLPASLFPLSIHFLNSQLEQSPGLQLTLQFGRQDFRMVLCPGSLPPGFLQAVPRTS